MNIIYSAQSSGINMFYNLSRNLDRELKIDNNIFLVSDSLFFSNWIKKNPNINLKNNIFIKEWEVFDLKKETYDLDILKKYESMFGHSSLMDALYSDRRIIMGYNCTFSQDYNRRFNDAKLLSILQNSLVKIDHIFQKYKPKLSMSFVSVTLFDYLLFLFSKYYETKFINIRPSRILNLVQLSSNLCDPSKDIENKFKNPSRIDKKSLDFAYEYIKNIGTKPGKYEGVIKPSLEPAEKLEIGQNLFNAIYRLLKNIYNYYSNESKKDNHCPNPLSIYLFKYFILPYRSKKVNKFLSKYYVLPSDFLNKEFAFFPLHTEPEVSLLVYAKPFFNQLEVIRYVASNLPIGMKLVIKEHPWMIGKRKLSAYKKMLNIPNVMISSPEVSATEWIKKSKFVSVISSSVGQEAVFLGKPVLTFGNVMINILPDHLVKNVNSLLALGKDIRSLLSNYKFNKNLISIYVASIKQQTIPLNLYSSLLSRKIAFKYNNSSFKEDLIILTNAVIKKIKAN